MKVYRITHIDNIPHILKHGIAGKNSPKANPNFVSIGDSSLISKREDKKVRVDNGDYLAEIAKEINLGDFTPYYFGIKMPMLYVIQNGGNFVPKAFHPSKIIYLAIEINNIESLNLELYFSDGHATDNFTCFFEKEYLTQINELLDWNAINSKYWGGEENLSLKRKKQAELLVRGDLPTEIISVFGCYNNESRDSLINIGVDPDKIKVVPRAYY